MSWIGCSTVLVIAASCGDASSYAEEQAQTSALAGVTRARIVAVNDLGMHCMDREYSVFSILPPFNVVHAQVFKPGPNSTPVLLDDTQVEVRYGAAADPTGSINSSSVSKTDFWQHASALFGAQLQPGEGLTGLYMPADAPQPGAQPMTYDATHGWFSAFGIPITPTDDAGGTNPYPLMRVSAYDRATGAYLAFTDIVVPVAQETDCQNCHATGQMAAVDPLIGWSNEPDVELQTKRNVLALHDARSGTQLSAQQPVLCASCHYSAALDLAGAGPNAQQSGHASMSDAMHRYHGQLLDAGGQPVFPPNGSALATCYQCHPGATTQCARGVMSSAGMECLDCHGDMASVGGVHPLATGGSIDGLNDHQPRRPWVDMPRCQSCHTGDATSHLAGAQYVLAPDGIRLRQAFRVGDPSASPIASPNSRFAENPGQLYRFSSGHGGLGCEMCHGSTHAEWPTMDPLGNDNKAAIRMQRHAGALIECGACHTKGVLPSTMDGPHGMHNVGDTHFLHEDHGEFFEHQEAACKACHGANLLGSALSKAAQNRTFQIEDDQIVHIPKGVMVRCDMCHAMPH